MNLCRAPDWLRAGVKTNTSRLPPPPLIGQARPVGVNIRAPPLARNTGVKSHT